MSGLSATNGAYLTSGGAYVAGSFVIETFDQEIRDGGPWYGGEESGWSPDPNQAFRGANAGRHDPIGRPETDRSSKWSMPGDGLDRYAKPGDTIRMAVKPQFVEDENGLYCGFIFGKPVDFYSDPSNAAASAFHSYQVIFDVSTYNDAIKIVRWDEGGDTTILKEDAENITDGDYYVLEAVYDGNGVGEHTASLYAADWDGPGTGTRLDRILHVELDTPDTTWRGEGMGLIQAGPGWLDELTVIPS